MTRTGAGHGRRGVVVGCVAVVASMAFGLYWISPLHDPENTSRARADAGRRAATVEDALHANFSSPLGGFSRSSEPVLDRVADRFGGTLIDVRSHSSGQRRDFEVLMSVPGTAAPKFSFDAEESTTVLVCYEFSWQGYVYTIEHKTVDCPKELPASSDAPGSGDDLNRLASRIMEHGSSAAANSPSARSAVEDTLREADVPSGTHRSITIRNDMAVFAVGSTHACVFGVLATEGLYAWRAPWAAHCTTDGAYEGYALTQWPPIGG
ncbi:hypothetical protein ACFXAW_11275 [Streptomyces sp. NPDC059445]|uniref:hypothetical protein n=1 Tax=Streptomyces sp. NPDC059445 TaxID=3346832 RepID=UPI0036BFEF3D